MAVWLICCFLNELFPKLLSLENEKALVPCGLPCTIESGLSQVKSSFIHTKDNPGEDAIH